MPRPGRGEPAECWSRKGRRSRSGRRPPACGAGRRATRRCAIDVQPSSPASRARGTVIWVLPNVPVRLRSRCPWRTPASPSPRPPASRADHNVDAQRVCDSSSSSIVSMKSRTRLRTPSSIALNQLSKSKPSTLGAGAAGSCYPLSWRGLRPGASTPGSFGLCKPGDYANLFPTTSPTAPEGIPP